MRITSTESTDLFTGTISRPLQITRVTLEADPGDPSDVSVRIAGAGATSPASFWISEFSGGTYEVPAEVASHVRPGTSIPVTVIAENTAQTVTAEVMITAAEPGWTMWMVSHFHYDPVWWSTQGQFTEARLILPDEDGKLPDVRTAFELVQVHLEKARRDADYKFVLAEIDYLKPYFDVYPADRDQLRRLLADGRVELVGGNYNEANTNLTGAESTIRNAVYGVGYQRDVLGGDPASAWMLDVFGHDPGYPGLMAQAGLTSSSWARGPFHQWGPGDNARMEFPAEFEWISPDGTGLLTAYMANHYGAGWVLNGPATLAEAEAAAYKQFSELARGAASRNVMLPVGSDHAVPARWVTDVHRSWNARYVWPRFVTAIPRDFFDAVRSSGARFTPQTRDMNPVYTGKDVSYIDTKQAHRAAEVAVEEGEALATVAALRGAEFPSRSLDRAWRLLAYAAHHDALTGTESDQVYLDLLSGWREAWQLGDDVRRSAAASLAAGGDGAGVVNGLGHSRAGVVTMPVAPGMTVDGVPAVSQQPGTVTFRADEVPPLGHRSFPLVPGAAPGWEDVAGLTISNEAFSVTADPARGGTVQVTDLRSGQTLLREPGNELTVQDEYDKHPQWGEGPWHLSPRGPGTGSSSVPAVVRAQRSPLGSRLLATLRFAGLDITQEVLLWDGASRVEFRTHVDGSIGKDRLLRVRFPADVPGGLPVYQTATAVIGRSFGDAEADAAQRWFTLDNPAWQWFGLGAVARVDHSGYSSAIGVAEIIAPNDEWPVIRPLVTALARCGVTATCSTADGPRCGDATLDSNLPDFRLALGGPDVNSFTAEVLASSPEHAKRLAGSARLWVPSLLTRPSAYGSAGSEAGPDLRGVRDLPVLIVTGSVDNLVDDLVADLSDGVITASGVPGDPQWAPPLAPRGVALLNRGTPSGVVSPDGTLWMSLMRACSSWPSGVWIDGDRRTVPDGSSFGWQHWSHTFEYALVSGTGLARSWGFSSQAEDYNHPLVAVPGAGTSGGVSVSPSSVSLAALKPFGNPIASGRSLREPSGEVTVRLRETTGEPVTASVTIPGGVTGAWLTDLLESAPGAELPAQDSSVHVDLPPFGTVTLVLRPANPLLAAPAGPAPAGPAPAGPAPTSAAHTLAASSGAAPTSADGDVRLEYARYWLHGTGPAPAGNLPVAVHVTPNRVALPADGDTADVTLTVACGPEPASGSVELVVPEGLSVTPAGPLPYSIADGGFASWDLTVQAAPGAITGRYFLGARIGQTVEEAALVAVGEAQPPDRDMDPMELFFRLQSDNVAQTDEVSVEVLTSSVDAAPGTSGEVRLRVTSGLRSQLRGEVQLLSPFGTWTPGDAWKQSVTVAPRGTTELVFPVPVPPGTRPGHRTWLLAKLMYFGRVRYTDTIPLTVTPPPR
jgi:alpha-mannosidase